jgi:hypothetical protein
MLIRLNTRLMGWTTATPPQYRLTRQRLNKVQISGFSITPWSFPEQVQGTGGQKAG